MVRVEPRLRPSPPLGALATVVLVAVLLMAVASLQGVPRFGDIALPHRPAPPVPTTGTQTLGGAGQGQPPDDPVLGAIAALIGIVIAAASLLLLLWLLWRAVRALWAARPPNRRAGGAVELGPVAAVGDDGVDAGTIRAAAADAQQAIDAHRDPGDAIVAAWVRLEEASARAGRSRAPSETPAEFALRILRRRPGREAELETLLGLYESVRFGGALADEGDRETARRCLAVIEEGWR